MLFSAHPTCFSQLVQREAVDLKVSLEALLINPRRQAGVLVLCRRREAGSVLTLRERGRETNKGKKYKALPRLERKLR